MKLSWPVCGVNITQDNMLCQLLAHKICLSEVLCKICCNGCFYGFTDVRGSKGSNVNFFKFILSLTLMD